MKRVRGWFLVVWRMIWPFWILLGFAAVVTHASLLESILSALPVRFAGGGDARKYSIEFQAFVLFCFSGWMISEYRGFFRPLGRYLHDHPAQAILLFLLVGLVFGWVGADFGFPDLIWGVSGRQRFGTGLAATVVLALLGINAYYLDGQYWRSGLLIQKFLEARQVPVTISTNPDIQMSEELGRFLRVTRRPFLLLLAVPALFTSFFTSIPKLEFPWVEASDRMWMFWSDLSGLACWAVGMITGIVLIQALLAVAREVKPYVNEMAEAIENVLAGLSIQFRLMIHFFEKKFEKWIWEPLKSFWHSLVPAEDRPVPSRPFGRFSVPDDPRYVDRRRGLLPFALVFGVVYSLIAMFFWGWVSPGLAVFALLGVTIAIEGLFRLVVSYQWRVRWLVLILLWVAYANQAVFKLQFDNLSYDVRTLLELARHDPRIDEASPARPRADRPALVGDEGLDQRVLTPSLDGQKLVSNQESLDAWLQNWKLQGVEKPKLTIVACSGGGARAAHWSATVLDWLDNELRFDRCALTLIKAKNLDELPQHGKNQIIVARLAEGLHLRAFDEEGHLTDDLDAGLLKERTRFRELEQGLEPFWDRQDPPSEAERFELIELIDLVVGHWHPQKQPGFRESLRLISASSAGSVGAGHYVRWLYDKSPATLTPDDQRLTGSELLLLPDVQKPENFPTTGKNRVILAIVKDVFQFRSFDFDGQIVHDTDERRLLGLDLKLVPGVRKVSEIPAAESKSVVVASVDGLLHVRVREADGRLTEVVEGRDLARRGPFAELGEFLRDFWTKKDLTDREKFQVIALAALAAGLDRLSEKVERIEDLRRFVEVAAPGLVFSEGEKVRILDTLRSILGPNPTRWGWLERLPTRSLDAVAPGIALNDLPAAFARYANSVQTDRGKRLEMAWEYLRDLPMEELRELERTAKLPSLVFSPITVEDGRRLFASNLDLSHHARPRWDGKQPRRAIEWALSNPYIDNRVLIKRALLAVLGVLDRPLPSATPNPRSLSVQRGSSLLFDPRLRNGLKDPSLVQLATRIDQGLDLLPGSVQDQALPASLNSLRYCDPVLSVSSFEFSKLFARERGFRMATAARMAATFPFITPSVYLPTRPAVRVVDSGFRDNYGVELAADWIFQNREWLQTHTSGVALIQIRSFGDPDARRRPADSSGDWPLRGYQFLGSVLQGAANTFSIGAVIRNDRLVSQIGELLNDRSEPRAEPFFTTVVFELPWSVRRAPEPVAWPSVPVGNSWRAWEASPGAITWALTGSEADAIHRVALPRRELARQHARKLAEKCEVFDPLKVLQDLETEIQAEPPDSDRSSALHWEYERARNYQRLQSLRRWWLRPDPRN